MVGIKMGRGHGTSKNFEKEKNKFQMLYTKLQQNLKDVPK